MASPLNLTTFNPSDKGIPSITNTNRNYQVLSGRGVKSIFSMGAGQFSPFPTAMDPKNGNVTSLQSAGDVHRDEIYDTSITSLVQYFNQVNDKGVPLFPSMRLDYADFAYLKDVGVFPNNRLMIARRFSSGVGNDLTSIKTSPLSTLISWVKEDQDFIDIKYNEEWSAADADFESVLNDIGEDVKASQDIQNPAAGSLMKRAFDILPLPGFMEGLQYQVMKNMGLTDAGIGNSPLGNPNMIAEAMRRKTIDFKSGDSGLIAKFSVKMTVEYEQKFINGIDPTLVYMDIIQNALTFGTSDSAFKYSSAFGMGVSSVIQNLISGDIGAIFKALASFVTSLLTALGNLIDTFGQCKLRDNTLSWKECSTFFASQNVYCEEKDETIIKWKKLIITRNQNSKLSENLRHKNKLFLDKTYDKQEIIKYCEELKKNLPIIKTKKEKNIIRDYQKEAIQLIKNMKKNLIINLPTGTGKNFIIARSLKPQNLVI